MSSRVGGDVNTEDIVRYIDKLKQEKRVTDQNICTLERERSSLDDQIAELERRRREVDLRLGKERDIETKQQHAVSKAETAYEQIVNSSRSLADFLKKEYQESRRE